jgi:hypothetical protein
MKEEYELAKEYDSKLRADDLRFRHSVVLLHEEGTFYHFRSAFILIHGEFIMVFSEHQGYHVFSENELVLHYQYKDVKIEKYE